MTDFSICQADAPAHRFDQNLVMRMVASLSTASTVYRQRQALKMLDTSRLQDLGISKSQANWEANRPFWDLPHNQ